MHRTDRPTWNDCQRIEAKRWLEQSSGHQYSRNSDATDEPKCMVSHFLTPRDPGRTRVGYAAQRLTTVAGELTKHLLLHTCILLFALTLLPTAAAQLNFTPGLPPLELTHNSLGDLMSRFSDATPDYFANRGINRVRQLPYEFGGAEGFATFVAAIPADKKVLVDLTEDDREECNHVELVQGYSPFSTWSRRSRLRYSVNLCKVRTRAMPLREFLLDEELKYVHFH
ncbi:hypothetical protein MAA_08363 [Metarhizium robertsii ARSEF 23]|uniref:Uncharacterized protein n=1 Tax=Metarhizium robertsii (strain ARSEF 23 / ATCC MYA-3075) TaxID=655844 RepID=E9F7W4_METRA|nr:uncharacterized protein MAA_08363 [Metarhizium robertsii ARSEF 23]EFY96252.2 hypothetical protein MAA_08363 [Metarhizium robertsii ARSEF 23]